MMPRSAARTVLTGTRIRALRTARGIGQADLARLAGVSPSYLNLIEHNRRRAGPKLLQALAGALDLTPEALTESSGEALISALSAAAGSAGTPDADQPEPELDRIEDFAGRFPGWARLVADLHIRTQVQDRTIERLSDRMAHDPNLAAALSEIVSAVTSVQSTAAILAETEDLAPEWRVRFHANIHSDSVRLAHAAEALVAWLDATGQETGLAAPLEELESWLMRRGFHLPELEPGLPGPAPDWAEVIADEPDLASQAGRVLAHDWIRRAGAEAQALPADVLSQALQTQLGEGEGLDPGALADGFGLPLSLVLRRLAALPATPGLPRFGLVLCDGSGTLTFRRPLDGFALPRFGGACPVWPLFQALQQPGRPVRELLETTARPPLRFLAFAVAEGRGPVRFAPPQAWESAMLITPATPEVLGALPPEVSGQPRTAAHPASALLSPLPVGAGCRVCAQAVCPARREPSIVLGRV
jgi:transcriptional regulator with XRE-family HTH domain